MRLYRVFSIYRRKTSGTLIIYPLESEMFTTAPRIGCYCTETYLNRNNIWNIFLCNSVPDVGRLSPDR